MSYETILMAKVLKITDDDTGMYSVGDIEGAFDKNELINYLNSYGNEGKNKLLDTICHMQWQIWQAWRDHNSKKDYACNDSSQLIGD